MKTFTQIISTLLTAVLVAGVGFLFGRHVYPKCPAVETRTDTVFVRDTIRDTVLVPRVVRLVRVDTVSVRQARIDTVYIDAEIPIERKVYETPDYRAEIEGFRPELISMEVYRQTQLVTQTQTIKVPDTRRWGLGIQAGYGASMRDGRLVGVPYIGVGLQYSIVKW